MKTVVSQASVEIAFAVYGGSIQCGSCTACCRGPGRGPLKVEPSPFYETIVRDGEHYMPATQDGTCIHARPDGCAIYDVRPGYCRRFDCRPFVNHPHVPKHIRRAACQRL